MAESFTSSGINEEFHTKSGYNMESIFTSQSKQIMVY